MAINAVKIIKVQPVGAAISSGRTLTQLLIGRDPSHLQGLGQSRPIEVIKATRSFEPLAGPPRYLGLHIPSAA